MRPARFFSLLSGVIFLTIAIAAAQDTNFPSGPQYLTSSVTSGSTLFLRSIETPTLSLGASLPPIPFTPEAPAAEETSAPSVSPSPQIYLSTVFWGEHSVADILGRVVVAPSFSVPELQLRTGVTSPAGPAAETVSEIEITSAVPLVPLPSSLFDSGVTGLTDAAALRDLGYGLPLGETASYWKTHKSSAPRVYTNADIQRFHPR